jgi:hypothetical protein
MNSKEKPHNDHFKTVKIPLNVCIKNSDVNLKKIGDYVVKANLIVVHGLQFMKLFILNYYHINNSIPLIDRNFINCCLKTVSERSSQGRQPTTNSGLMEILKSFYDDHYSKLVYGEKISYTHMKTVLEYLSVSIVTSYENNIKQHFVNCVERYLNIVFKKSERAKTDNKEKFQIFLKVLKDIKNDILNVEINPVFKSDSKYHDYIKDIKNFVIPRKKEFAQNHIRYDLKVSPWDYFPCMIFMMREIEKQGMSMLNIFPLRSEIIPHHIRIDTNSLIYMLITKNEGNKDNFSRNLKKKEDEIWNFFFDTKLKCFNKKYYSFHHMIETDGVSCSVILLRKDLVGNKNFGNPKLQEEEYIDELKTYSELQGKKIVAIDPGKSDIIYCVDAANKDANIFRYTQNQRRKVSNSKSHRNIILQQKKEEKIDNRNITELETELSKYNKKILDVEKFKEYVKKKNKLNFLVGQFYQQKMFRKFKLSRYINTKRDEQNMINDFKKKFGNEKEVVICFGDFEQKQQMKFKEPTIGKGLRTLFRKNNFKVYLVDEFRTSCKCSKCGGGSCETFLERENPRPFRKGMIKIWGLLKCKTCGSVWNRDRNGASNIYKVAENAIKELNRPDYLRRNNQSVVLNDITNKL